LVYQLRHTGTPWGAPVSPFGSWAAAFKSFGGNAHAAGWLVVLLVLLGVFASAAGDRQLTIDMTTRPGVRLEAIIAFGTIALGLVVARVSGTTFEGRYAAVVFPLIVLVAAFGLTAFGDRRIRAGVLVLALALGVGGGAGNAARNRTQAYQLAPIIKTHAVPGDVVVYCPDSIGTDVVDRIGVDVTTIAVPGPGSPERIDWVDYEARVRAIEPEQFAAQVLNRAGRHAIWFVYTNNGTFVDQQCDAIADFLSLRRPNRIRELEPDPYFFEHQGLYRYPAPAPA
jgi:mannosyltransferase